MIKEALSVLNFLFGGTKPLSGPLKVHWDLEYLCNSRCKNCNRWKEKRKSDQLSPVDSKKLLNELSSLGVKNISFAGNEPTLREDLIDLISYAKSLKMTTSLNTNAILLNEDYVKNLINAGIDMIYFSIDGYDDETQFKIRGVKNNLKSIIKAKNYFKIHGQHVKVMANTVVNHINLLYLEKIVEFIYNEKFDGMLIQPAHNIPIYFEQDKESIITKEDIPILEKKIDYLWKKYKKFLTLPREYYRSFGLFYRNPEILKRIPCTAGYLTLDIRQNGELVPCPVGFASGGVYKPGNLRKLWYGKRMNQIRKNIRKGKHPQCWFACIIPINIILYRIKRLDFRVFNASLIKHIIRKIGL